MSRWVQGFENHAFRATWESLKNNLKSIEVDSTTPTYVEELARLKKVISCIEKY